MEKNVNLKDGSDVLICDMGTDDIDRSLAFFRGLPGEDRMYLRADVTDREIVKQRIGAIEASKIVRLVAIVDEQIVADGSLESEGRGWKEHIAELRMIVGHAFQRRGLGMLMARELYYIAASKKVEEIVAKFMAPQVGAQNILTKLGFHQEAVFHDYVKDTNGYKQDLVIMRCNLEALWQKLEAQLGHSDWQRTR